MIGTHLEYNNRDACAEIIVPLELTNLTKRKHWGQEKHREMQRRHTWSRVSLSTYLAPYIFPELRRSVIKSSDSNFQLIPCSFFAQHAIPKSLYRRLDAHGQLRRLVPPPTIGSWRHPCLNYGTAGDEECDSTHFHHEVLDMYSTPKIQSEAFYILVGSCNGAMSSFQVGRYLQKNLFL